MQKVKSQKNFSIFRGVGFKHLSNAAALLDSKLIESKEEDDSKSIKSTKENDSSQANLKHLYEPQSNINLDNRNIVDPFVKFFYCYLSDKFGIKFEAIHLYPLWWIFEHFVCHNPELVGYVKFHPSHAPAFTRHYADIKTLIQKQLKNNKKSYNFFGGHNMKVQDFSDKLKEKMEPYFPLYWEILKETTSHTRIGHHRYHTLYLNAIWFVDSTAVAELGNNIHKDTGPNVLIILEAATKKVMHYKMFRSKNEMKQKGSFKEDDVVVDSQAILKEIIVAIEMHNCEYPIILHSDSENKNKSPNYYLKLLKLGIIPSLNKTIYGPIKHPHLNQVIENFNLNIKKKLKKVIQDSNYILGTLESVSLKEKQMLFAKTLDIYHNSEHTSLSKKGLSKRNYIPITPNQSYESHSLFQEIYIRYIALKDNSNILPKNRNIIEGLDLTCVQDQERFVEYVANYLIVFHFNNNTFNIIYDLLELKNGNLRKKSHNYVYDVIQIFFAFALAKGSNKRLQAFFESPYIFDSFGLTGPGRERRKYPDYVELLTTKEDFDEHTKVRAKLNIDVVLRLHVKYVLWQQGNDQLNNTLLVFKKTDEQTQELKEHFDNTVKLEVRQLKTTIDDLKEKLEVFYQKERVKEELKSKRKNRQKRDLTPPINLGHFMKALNLVKTNVNATKNPSKLFGYARNRLVLFLMYFSGIRIGMITKITIFDLISIFQEDKQVGIPISKTRDQKKEQVFSVGSTVRERFIYGDHNLWNDFKYVLETFDSWAKANNISPEDCYSKPFFAKYADLSKPCRREFINKNINSIVRNAGKEMGMSKKDILTFSSHSFRIQFITHFINRYGIRKTQLHMGHQNINNTASYDRNTFPVKQVNNLTDSLCFNKQTFKAHPDVQQYSDPQLQLFANIVADQHSIPSSSSNLTEEINRLNADYLPQEVPSLNYCSDLFDQIEQECHQTELSQQIKLNKVIIDPTKAEGAKKHLEYVKNASKKAKSKKKTT